MPSARGFIAYPSEPAEIGTTIEAAVRSWGPTAMIHGLQTWKEMEIAGQFLSSAVLTNIDSLDFLCADITTLNFNVIYEIRFAIGRSKPILLIRSASIRDSLRDIDHLGIFDTIGYETYESHPHLLDILRKVGELKPLFVNTLVPDTSAPLYYLDAKVKSDSMITIKSRIKKAGIKFRGFDPDETSRLSAVDAIEYIIIDWRSGNTIANNSWRS